MDEIGVGGGGLRRWLRWGVELIEEGCGVVEVRVEVDGDKGE